MDRQPQLAVEARALRPSLRIVLASDPFDELGRAASAMVRDRVCGWLSNGAMAAAWEMPMTCGEAKHTRTSPGKRASSR